MIVIAMTREIGSHGSDVAVGLVNELRLTVINSEIVASKVAGRHRGGGRHRPPLFGGLSLNF
jgi:hypothetical protein